MNVRQDTRAQFQWSGTALVTRLAIERPTVVPIGELCRRTLRIHRIRKLGENPAEISFSHLPIASERPTFGKACEIFAAIVLTEIGKCVLPKRQGAFKIGGRLRRQLAHPCSIPL